MSVRPTAGTVAALLAGLSIAAMAGAATGTGAARATSATTAVPASRATTTTSSATQPGAPWPTMRHDLRNTGASDLVGRDPGIGPWSFPTGGGIFSTPVVAADGTIYVGSADHTLYGLDRTGREVWRYTTGGIIDTAPALLAPEAGVGDSLVLGSGDEVLRRIRTDPGVPDGERVVWELTALPPAEGSPQLVSWWEGSPNVGPDGTIYQGNTGSQAYAITSDGTIRWTAEAANAVWTVPAVDERSTTYWGSVDARFFALDAAGQQLWQRTTLGYVTSSPAMDTSGVLYQGSFDGSLYALDSADGSVRWRYPTGDHIYASPALIEDADGALQQVVIASTDGLVHSVSPDGALRWTYDTGAPVRSSPVVGPAPDGTPVVYVGSSNGLIVAIDADDGTRRWAYDTTSEEPTLATRNMLNSSPALTADGVVTGSQDGTIWFVPYDYCLRVATDERCVPAGVELPADGSFLFGVDVGGRLVPQDEPVRISPAGYFVGRLVVREGGRTVPARIVPAPDPQRLVTVEPAVDVSVSFSGDGRYVFVRPLAMLAPSTDYTVTVQGVATTGGPRVGNVHLGTGDLAAFRGSFRARTGDDGVPWNPTIAADAVSGLQMSRLAVPLPPMLTSVNQIGFDSYDWVGGVVRTDPGNTVVWFVGAKPDADGTLVADPEALFAFPVAGRQRGGTFSWNADEVNLWFTFGPVPLRRFDLRGTFRADGQVGPDAQHLVEAVCADIPSYGTQMPLTGMCDTVGVITAGGTFLGTQVDSPALRRVPGLSVGEVRRQGRAFTVDLALAPGTRYPSDAHFVSVLLLDAVTGDPVPLDYYSDTTMRTDEAGNVVGTSVQVPDGVALPARIEAHVMTDAFPAATATFEGGGA
jgi:outer membrane protein assembly factor BamB